MNGRMKKLGVALFGALCLLGAPSRTRAQNSPDTVVQSPDQAVAQDAAEYAQRFVVPLAEASARLRALDASIVASDAIRATYAGRLAGIAVEHQPQLQITVLLTGDEAVPGTVFYAAGIDVPIVYRTGARATREAALSDVAAVLQPEQSALAELHEAVGPLVTRQGAGYVARLGARPRPRGDFLGFLTRASDVSRTLYGDGGGARVNFSLRPRTSAEVAEVSVTVDGRTRTFTRTTARSESFAWHGADGGGARLVARVGGTEVTVAEGQGTWAAFRMFRGASWQSGGEGRWLASWRVPGASAPLVVEVRLADLGVPVFNPDYLGRLTCVRRVVP